MVIKNFIYQIIFTVGIVVGFGLLISLCRKAFCRIVGANGGRILLATGIVGTPIHELSHALMCIIFGHRIVEMKLYDPDSYDGTLGYVNHSYNPRNIYHQIGNFFIGIAPIVCGSGVLLLLLRIFVPASFSNVFAELRSISGGASFGEFFPIFGNIISEVFAPSNLKKFSWWIFIILALMVASHMELSTADICGAALGFAYMAGLLLIVDIVLGIFARSVLIKMTGIMTSFAVTIASFLAISAVFSGVMILVALIIRLFSKIRGR